MQSHQSIVFINKYHQGFVKLKSAESGEEDFETKWSELNDVKAHTLDGS